MNDDKKGIPYGPKPAANKRTDIYVILQLWRLYQAYTSGLEKNSSSHRKHTIILNLVYLFNSISYSFFLKMR